MANLVYLPIVLMGYLLGTSNMAVYLAALKGDWAEALARYREGKLSPVPDLYLREEIRNAQDAASATAKNPIVFAFASFIVSCSLFAV